MRAFAALALPDGLADMLSERLPAPPPQLRAIPPHRWHLTLAFYGELDDAGLACVAERLERRLGRWDGPVPRLRIGGGGAFPGGAVYVGAVGDGPDDDERTRRLATLCIRTGIACGAPGTEDAQGVERVRFRPHITVARSRVRRRIPADYVAALQSVSSPPWNAARVQLIASFLGSEPRYETLRTYPLQP